MNNYKKVKVGDLLVLPACSPQAYFKVTEIVNPMLMLVSTVDVYGNEMSLDLRYANCRYANFIDRIKYRIKQKNI